MTPQEARDLGRLERTLEFAIGQTPSNTAAAWRLRDEHADDEARARHELVARGLVSLPDQNGDIR